MVASHYNPSLLFSLSHFAIQNYTSFIGINDKLLQHICQYGGDKKAIKYGINYATKCASTLYQVGDELLHLYKVEVRVIATIMVIS